MPKIASLKYEFIDYDDANAVLSGWRRARPGDLPDFPTFSIDRVEVDPDDETIVTIWLKLKA